MEDHTLNQMISIDNGIADKIEDHIERIHQVDKRFKRRYQSVADSTQSQTSQIRLQDLLSNPIVDMKSEQIKEETKAILIVKDHIHFLIYELIIVICLLVIC